MIYLKMAERGRFLSVVYGLITRYNLERGHPVSEVYGRLWIDGTDGTFRMGTLV